MEAARLLRVGGVALAATALVSATAMASMPSTDTITASSPIARASASISQSAQDAATLPLPSGTMTQAEMRGARTAHAQIQAEQASAAATARAKAKAKSKIKKRGKKAATKDGEEVTNTGPIPVAATQKSRQIQALVKKHFPADQIGNAMAVAACESGHSDAIGATNSDGTTDFGAFQLNDGGTLQGSLSAIGVSYTSKEHAQKLALNTEINVRAAAKIYAARGWQPWVCAYKIGVLGSLYGSDKGPMYGKFDAMGVPTVEVPTITVGPGQSNKRNEPAKKKTAPKAKSKTPKPTTPAKATPKTTPRPTSTPDAPSTTPTATPTKTPSEPAVQPGQEAAESASTGTN